MTETFDGVRSITVSYGDGYDDATLRSTLRGLLDYDVIVTGGGIEIEGKVVTLTADGVLLDVKGEAVTFAWDDIEEVKVW